MRDAEATKNTILEESANLFNTQGYKATSLSDITKATGFTKGAIYRHFNNKQELETAALSRLSTIMFEELGASIRAANTFREKFEAVFSYFENYMHSPLYEGGCPLMNVAVEADDSNPILRRQAMVILKELRQSVTKLIENGIKNGQVLQDVDSAYFTTIIIGSLEGGIMMSRLEQNESAIRQSVQHLRSVVDSISIEKRSEIV
ncbi:TetR/AcrR family transcriptional regulator [Luteirhabdus pelagi]|uniref:TetR/AcrR family transcriptional regulator n=1 Tax=Luteirhabdus pelagi TaxID=2792783 RepID=UPI001939EFC8|nr:TetR/AcrR family transcriptional regulator [Luteirhabdus pelagi]